MYNLAAAHANSFKCIEALAVFKGNISLEEIVKNIADDVWTFFFIDQSVGSKNICL